MSSSATATPVKSSTVVIVAFCCLATIGEGFSLQAPGVTLPVLGPLFKLTTGAGGGFWDGFFSQKSLFLSISTFGMMFGALIGGRLSDRIGRKWVAVASVLLFGVLSALAARSVDGNMFLWCRFFTGVGIGGALPSLISIVTETVSLERRNTAIGFLYASMPVGGSIVSLCSYLFANPQAWPTIYYLGAIVPIVAIPGLIFGVPDLKPTHHQTKSSSGIAAALFGEGRAAQTVILWVAFFFALITMYIMLGWLPSLLVGKGLSRPEASIVQIGFNVFGAVGSVITGILIDRPGRAVTVALIFLSAVVSLGILAGAPASLGISFIVGSLVGCTLSGTQAIVYALAPSCYPAQVRGTGVGFGVAVGRFGSATGPLLAGAMLGGGWSAAQVLSALVPIMTIAAVCAVIIGGMTRRAGQKAALDAVLSPT